MNQHHPIDDLFNRKLETHVSETPMHLWDKIDQRRNWKYKLINQIRLHRQSLLLLVSLILLLGVSSWHLSKSSTPALGHFPVFVSSTQNFNDLQAQNDFELIVPDTETTPIIQEKQLLVPVKPNPESALITKGTELAFNLDVNKAVIPPQPEDFPEQLLDEQPGIEEPPFQKDASSEAGIKLPPLNSIATLDISPDEGGFLGLFNPDPKCAKFKHGQWFLYLDMLASPDIPIRSLKAKNNLYYSYVQNREQTESVEFSYSVGFRLSAVSGFGMAIRTGLNYSQINEQFNYYNENEERITIHTITDPITGEIIGTDTTVVHGVRHKVTHNKFQIVDLPLILGYEMDYKKFIFTFNAGAHINLYFESDGDFLSPDLEPVSFSSNDPDGLRAFRNHLGIGWYSSVGVQYQLSPRFNVLFEPYFKMYPKGFSRSQYIVEQQYLSMGFSIGIRQKI